MKEPLNIAVFGIGNTLLSDDGAGVHALHRLLDDYELPSNVTLIDGGTKGLDLLPLFENRDRVLIIDAANFRKPPGSIDAVYGERIPSFLSAKLSVHQIGLPDLLFAAKLMQVMPDDICLIGIQPESMETGTQMSDAVMDRMDDLLLRIIKELQAWGVNVQQKVHSADNSPG